jgi:transcriptional regulator with XRE-family HTH domain
MKNNEKQTREQICSLIAEIRRDKLISTYELAKLTGIRSEYLTRIEQGKRSVGLDLLLKITSALEVEIKIEQKKTGTI